MGCGVFAVPCAEAVDGRAELELRQQQLKDRIGHMQAELTKNVATRNHVETEVREAARGVARTARRIDQLHRAVRQAEAQQRTLEQRRGTLNDSIRRQREQLAQQLRAAYVTGRVDYIKVLFNQQDPAKAGRVLKYFDYYHAHRARQVEALQAEILEVNVLETTLAQHKDTVTRRLTDLQQERTALDQQLEHRQQLLVKFDTSVAAQGQALVHAREDIAQLERLLANLRLALVAKPTPENVTHPPIAQGKGRLSWPVSGQVQAEYGRPRNQGGLKWTGILIAAPEGTPVRCVAGGQVVFADWMPGYGLVLIVDHGQGFLSLYGYNHTLVKEAGDRVEADETIATVGRGTAMDTTGLYFEIRRDGKPTDPRGWLASRGR